MIAKRELWIVECSMCQTMALASARAPESRNDERMRADAATHGFVAVTTNMGTVADMCFECFSIVKRHNPEVKEAKDAYVLCATRSAHGHICESPSGHPGVHMSGQEAWQA